MAEQENKKPENALKIRENSSLKKEFEYGRKPDFFWFGIVGTVFAINLTRLAFHIHAEQDPAIKKMEGPLVIVGNHPSYIDPIIMGSTIYGRKINFVAGAFLFRNKIFRHIISTGGCIPKMQFKTDLRAVKAMMRVLSRGGVLGIFPEGTRFVDGSSIPFDNGLAQLIKKTNSGLVFLESHGAYMSWPRWSTSTKRRGKITAKLVNPISSEEISKMSVDEIQAVMARQLDYNEYDYFSQHPQKFTCRAPAEGAQNVANICPKCEGMNTMRAKKNRLFCSACGNAVLVNDYGFFEPETPDSKYFPDLHKWVCWEKTIYAREAARPDYCFTEKVELQRPYGENDYALVGKGVLTIKDGQVIYEGTACPTEDGIVYKKGKPIRKHKNRDISKTAQPEKIVFSIKSMKGFVYDFGLFIEFYEKNGTVDRIFPQNRQRIYEISEIIQAMRKQPEAN